jgi:hypothetical protein
MEYESDSSRGGSESPIPSESPQEIEARNDRLEQFRQTLASWKKTQLNNTTKDEQDVTKLNKFIDDCSALYLELRDVIDGKKPSRTLENHSLWKQMGGQQNQYFPIKSPLDRAEMSHIVFRDLVEFPFTFNTSLINSFPRKDSLEDAEILSMED